MVVVHLGGESPVSVTAAFPGVDATHSAAAPQLVFHRIIITIQNRCPRKLRQVRNNFLVYCVSWH